MRWVAAAQLCGCVTVAGTPAPVDEWATARADRVAEASAYVARRWAEPLGSLPTPETRPSILGTGEDGADPDKSERIRDARADAVTRHRPGASPRRCAGRRPCLRT